MQVVVNTCYGGFGLSREAILLARKISGDPTWGGATIEGDQYDDGKPVTHDYGFVHDIKRTDPILLQVVATLGDKANGSHAALSIADVCGPYRIEEYDGREMIMTPGDYKWENE